MAAAPTPTHCRDISRRTFIFVSQVRATPRAAHPPPYETVQTYEAEAQRPLRRPEDGTSRPSGTTILGPDVERRRGGNLMIGYPGPMSQPQAPITMGCAVRERAHSTPITIGYRSFPGIRSIAIHPSMRRCSLNQTNCDG